MADYRIYFMTRDGHIGSVVELDCLDDTAALGVLASQAHPHGMELWQLDRRVAVTPPKPPETPSV